MNDLRSEQLESIRRLLLDPLRDAVRQEIRLSHQTLAASLTTLNERFDQHAADYQRRITRLEHSAARIKLFRDRIVMAYGILVVAFTAVWSVVRQKVIRWLQMR